MRFWPGARNVPHIPFSDDARAVLDRAAEEARRRGTAPIAPDHILLALIVAPTSRIGSLLRDLGIDVPVLQQQLEARLPSNPLGPEQLLPTYTADARRVLEDSLYEAAATRLPDARAEQLLVGILRAERSRTARTLRQSGAQLVAVRQAIRTLPS